ncbi:MAG TPA: prolipoprotein diacylglyceryl transferase [Pyrinomonadaceae bacterium]|nr:prolipoprotein diacylglyceryl transferase [Pyrinomonadaceae bacterium]
MYGPFIHRIDPVFGEFAGFYLWFYGLSYSLGFLSIFLWFKRVRRQFGLTIDDIYSLTIYLAVGVLVGGRLIEVFFYEWPYYQAHLWQIPAVWLGGMSTHGVLLGVVVTTGLFCRFHGKSLLLIADQLVIPGSYLMGMGRIGNFIDGQIVGSITNICWAVQFPDAPGFRHPVVLYDGAKNFFILGLLLLLRRFKPAPGILTAHFIFWYGFLRIFVDLFREYPTNLFGIATGQAFNIFMAALGALLLFRFSRKGAAKAYKVLKTLSVSESSTDWRRLWLKRIVFASLLLFSLTLPSDWTQDIPARYGKRHAGMHYSRLYPHVEGNIPDSLK